jgi:hypothetical protein
MRIIFKYDSSREYQNFRLTFRSLNHKRPSARQLEFFKRYQRLTPVNARRFAQQFCRERNVSPHSALKNIRRQWQSVERLFFQRADRVFRSRLTQQKITVYFTIHDRCSYNLERGYFFIHGHLPSTNKTIMHELWHWYFHFTVGATIHKLFGQRAYNDIKESLTVLLNDICSDLMPGVMDVGYPQHRRLRRLIRTTYRHTNDIYTAIGRSFTYRSP